MLKKVLTLIVLLLMIATTFNPLLGSAETNISQTIYVDDDNVDGPWDGSLAYPFQAIQEGLNASSDGDTVFVFNGTYTELVTIETEVALIGENNSATILQDIITNTYSNPKLVTISADNVTVENFYIRQHNNTNIQHGLFGIYCIESDGILIQHNNFVNCNRGIHLRYSSGNILDNHMVYEPNIGITAVVFQNPTNESEITISNNTFINFETCIQLNCWFSMPSKMLIDYNHMESSAGQQPSIEDEDSWAIRLNHYPFGPNYQMRISHNVITGFHIGFYYKDLPQLGSKLDESSVDIFSNTFNNTEKDLLLYPNSRWSKETITITKNNFLGQNNNVLFYELITLDPSILQFTSMIHKSLIDWNNNYWANQSPGEKVRIPGRMVVWLSYLIPADILRIPIFQTDPNPADEPFEI